MEFTEFLVTNWHVKTVSVILILAAWIDGRELRVPELDHVSDDPCRTCLFHIRRWPGGFGAGLLGMCVGLLTLLPLYAVGGMGAGDVKLMAGIGAWLGWEITFAAFCVSTVVGAVMAVLMVLRKGTMKHHYENFLLILSEWMVIKNPSELSRIAAERKPRMMLLPYGIPICIGTIGYFLYQGMM